MVRKGQFAPGDRAIYLPESAVLPDAVIEELGLAGKLAGSAKNRIKAIRLRGCLSQGILHPAVPEDAVDGENFAARLGVTKYEPPIPAHMAGEVADVFGLPLKFDVENVKAFPDVLREDEEVEFSEKAHGSFCGIAVVPGLGHPEMVGADGLVYSKGLGAKGLAFKDAPANAGNIQLAAAKALDLHARLRETFPGRTVHLLGEVYGAGVQDLTYGRRDRAFVAFDLHVDGAFLDRTDFHRAVGAMGVDASPVLYHGPYSRAEMLRYTDGRTVLGGGAHAREGVVVRPARERRDDALGRVILKSVSADYLLRKGDATEFT